MGDIRFVHPYERLRESKDPAKAIRALSDDDVVGALATAAASKDPYLANVLATETQNRLLRRARAINSMNEALVIVDLPDRRILKVNPAAERMFGYSADELLGKTTEILHVNRANYLAFGRTTEEMLARAESAKFEYTLKRADGHVFPTEEHVSPMLNAVGERAGFIILVRDITERKAAEAEIRKLAALVEASPDAIVGKSPDGTITSWNSACERIFGYRASEVVGQPVAFLIPEERREEQDALLERARRGEAVSEVVVDRLSKDGTRLFLALSLAPVRDASGEVVALVAIHRLIARTPAERRLETRSAST